MPTTQQLNLYSYDATPDGTVKIPSLMKAFQQIARVDLDTHGVTYNMMRDANQVFVIIKARIEIKKKISIYDTLYLKTVPTKIQGIIFFRDFRITDADGNLYAVCSTSWVLVNYASRRILKPAQMIADIPHYPEEESDVILTRRFDPVDSPISKSTNVRKIYFSNLDENNHFNNAETASFAIDEIADRIIGGENIKTFEIHFTRESKLGEEIELTTQNTDKASYIFANNITTGNEAFTCMVEFE
ncbi:MAG: hypothetical protein IKU43_07775 [Clostridia bacterium]|nr:hypothetical protein [Clostridia bacterium]